MTEEVKIDYLQPIVEEKIPDYLKPFFRKGYFTGNIKDATIHEGIVKQGKNSLSDTSRGYFLSKDGFYIGDNNDTTKLKFDVSSGTFDFVGTISGRSTATIASAINSSGNLVKDVINARLDSSSKKILSDFDFGSANYAGALKAGDITWDTSTGAITGGSGVVVYRKGIVGAKDGSITFSIDAETGDATFAGTLSAPNGTLGTITAGTLSGVIIKANKTSFSDYTNAGIWMGEDGGIYKFHLGNGTTYFTYNGAVSQAFQFRGAMGITTNTGIGNSKISFGVPFGTGTDGFRVYDDYHAQAHYFAETYNVCSLPTWEANGNISGTTILNSLISTGGTDGSATQTIDKGWIKIQTTGSGTSYIQSRQAIAPSSTRNSGIFCEFVIDASNTQINRIGFYKDANNYCYLYTNPSVSTSHRYLAVNSNGLGEHLVDLGAFGSLSGRFRIEITSEGTGKIKYKIYRGNWTNIINYGGGEYSISSGADPTAEMSFKAEVEDNNGNTKYILLRNIKFGEMINY